MSWRFPGATHARRVARPAFALLLPIPFVVLALAPLAGQAIAQPAHPTAPAIGKSSSPAVDLTLHHRSTLSGVTIPVRMGTDAAGNLYVADRGVEKVLMYNASDTFERAFGTGAFGTANGDFKDPRGIAISGDTVFIADNGNASRIMETVAFKHSTRQLRPSSWSLATAS